MRLPVQVIESFEDATLNFEQIESIFSGPQAEPLAFLQLLSAQKLQLSIGLASLNFAGATTASAVITHSIGRNPAVWLTFNGAPGLQLTLGADTITATQFTMHGLASAAIAGSINVFWLALG